MSRVNWRYLAGFTDGDGCIQIPRYAMQRPSQIHICWYQKDCNADVLNDIADFLEGHGIDVKWYLHPKWDVWHLRVNGAAQVEFVLKKLRRHLIVKEDKCEEALEILRIAPRGRHTRKVVNANV